MGESGNRRVCSECWEEFEAPAGGDLLCPSCVAAGAAAPPDPLDDDDLGPEVWREGLLLVMGKDEELPESCVKCDGPAVEGGFRRPLYWHPPAIYFLWLLGPVGYLIGALATRKQAIVYLPVCVRHRRIRRWWVLAAWGLVAAGFGLLFAGPAHRSGTLALVGLGCLLVGASFAVVVDRLLLRPKKMDDEYVWLAGACREYLARLPDHPPAYTGL